jgi:Fic family protein
MNNAGAGMAIGVAIGLVIGTAIDNLAMGVALGVVLGVILEAQNRRKAKEKQQGDAGEKKGTGGSTAAKEEKERHIAEILAFAAGKESIRNDDIQALLGVSDATTERYLNELEQEGKLVQIGKTGRSVSYKSAAGK